MNFESCTPGPAQYDARRGIDTVAAAALASQRRRRRSLLHEAGATATGV